MRAYLSRAFEFICYLAKRFFQDGCTSRAGELTFTSLLALVPLMTVSFIILSAFPKFDKMYQKIQTFVFSHFVADSGQAVQNYLHQFVQHAAQLSVFGIAFLIVTALLMIHSMADTFNVIWKVHKRRHGVSAFVLYWSVLTLTPILIGVSLVISSYLFSLPFISTAAQTLRLQEPLLRMTPFLLSACAFTILYVVVPNCVVPLRSGLMAGIITAVLFELAKRGFAVYVTSFQNYKIIYGSLVAVPFFLIWVYIMWLIILFGALLSQVFTFGFKTGGKIKLDPFSHAYRWIGYFWQAQVEGNSLTLREILKRDTVNYEVEPAEQMQILIEAKLIRSVSKNRYVLSRDLSHVSLLELHRLLPWKLPYGQQLRVVDDVWAQRLREQLQTVNDSCESHLSIALNELY